MVRCEGEVGGKVEIGAVRAVLKPGRGDVAVGIHRAAQDGRVGDRVRHGIREGNNRRGGRSDFADPLVGRVEEVDHPGAVDHQIPRGVDPGGDRGAILITKVANHGGDLVRGIDQADSVIKRVGDIEIPRQPRSDSVDPSRAVGESGRRAIRGQSCKGVVAGPVQISVRVRCHHGRPRGQVGKLRDRTGGGNPISTSVSREIGVTRWVRHHFRIKIGQVGTPRRRQGVVVGPAVRVDRSPGHRGHLPGGRHHPDKGGTLTLSDDQVAASIQF